MTGMYNEDKMTVLILRRWVQDIENAFYDMCIHTRCPLCVKEKRRRRDAPTLVHNRVESGVQERGKLSARPNNRQSLTHKTIDTDQRATKERSCANSIRVPTVHPIEEELP